MVRQLLRGATILDGTGSDPTLGDIVVEGGVIVDIGTGLDADIEFDYTGRWIMPGVIDCHVHVMVEDFDLMKIIETPFSLSFYMAALNLKTTLAAGVTFVRDTGGADLGVKRALELGYLTGPSMQIAVNLLSMTGGHADHWSACGYATPDLLEHPGRPDGVCDGITEVIRRTREMIRAGADFVKVCSTGGVLSPQDHPEDAQFLPSELEAIVAAAGLSHRRVAAHAQGSDGIKNAIRAGAWSIEHGSMLDDEAIDLMLTNGTFLVPTLSALEWLVANPQGRRADEVAKAAELVEIQRVSIRKAVAAGVQIALGSDAGVGPHGRNLDELGHLVRAGMTASQAVTAATVTGARVLGIEETHGVLSPGKRADILVLDHDPLTDIDRLSEPDAVHEVWKSGVRHSAAQLRSQPSI